MERRLWINTGTEVHIFIVEIQQPNMLILLLPLLITYLQYSCNLHINIF